MRDLADTLEGLCDDNKSKKEKSVIDQIRAVDFWVKQGLHGIDHVMKKDSNLEKFINKPEGKPNGETGYSAGSSKFTGSLDGFGD